MYYRIAIQRRGDPLDRPAPWQWKSTVLSSLQSLFQVLRLYNALPPERLRVFSSPTRQGLEEQLVQENSAGDSASVTAAHFLQGRWLASPEVTRGKPARDEDAERRWQPSLMGAIAARSHPAVKENGTAGNDPVGKGGSFLEGRRLEHERGAGGDHDVPYHFVLPLSLPQVLAWMELMGRVQRGELQP